MAEKVVIQLEADTSKAVKGLEQFDKKITDTTKQTKKVGGGMAKAFTGAKTAILGAVPALNAFKGALISTGIGAFVVALGALTKFFIDAGKKGAEFGKALSGLKAVAGATEQEMSILSDQAKELGSTTAFTASQVVKLQTELAKLGFTVADIRNATPAILDLAASLEVDLSSAAEFAGSVVRSFGLTTEETQRVVDVMALSTASSALNFDALTESLKVVAPTSKAVGISIERTTALLGVLADTGLKGSIAGTGLSKTFIALNKEGISLEEAMDKVRRSSNQLNTAVELVGVVGAKSLLNLASSGDKIGDLEDKFNNAAGAAKNIAETRLDNLAGDTTKLGSAWEGFLLNIEDGSGAINKLARGGVQFLTKAITFLQDSIEFTAFAFKDGWRGIKEFTNSGVQITGGYLDLLGQGIKLFANNALLSISEIPILGRAIDKEQIEQNIKLAQEGLQKANDKIDEGVARYREEQIKQGTAYARFAIEQETKATLLAKKQQQKQIEEEQDLVDADADEKEQERLKQREKDLAKLAKIEKDFIKKQEDLEDVTELAKAQRKRERALAEIEALKLTEEEKRKAIAGVNDYYDQVEAEAKEQDDVITEEKRLANLDILKKQAEEERQIELQKIRDKQMVLDAVSQFASAETGIGKALLIAKQALALKETLLDLKRITFKGTQAVSEAGVSTAQNVAQSSKIGFPQNIITIAAAIGQGISIIRNVKKAVSKTKAGAAAAAGGVSTPSVATPSASSQPPAFNIVGASGTNQLAETIAGQNERPIKAFVTSQDVTTAQSLERNIVEGASI